MRFRIFSLHPGIFDSFLGTSLIARGIAKRVIEVDVVNWRSKYGLGRHRQVDDRPFGGGSGMVLMPQPIAMALQEYQAVSPLFVRSDTPRVHDFGYPPNARFLKLWQQSLQSPAPISKLSISLTPRGFPLTQPVAEWLAGEFTEINLLCGRYEGFDARVSDMVDLELSVGNFVLNGGEVAAMALVEAVSRLLPGFVTKNPSVLHDSFSSALNYYPEQREFVIGKRRLQNLSPDLVGDLDGNSKFRQVDNLFDDTWWQKQVLPYIEHPQYTRPEVWSGLAVPPVLLGGDHKAIQDWRVNWYTSLRSDLSKRSS